MKAAGKKQKTIDVSKIRFGLCCKFSETPIRFRTTTVRAVRALSKKERQKKLGDLCRINADVLMQALLFCAQNGIGSFRINSQILPLKTHPEAGYDLRDLPGGLQTIAAFRKVRTFARHHDIRMTLHPDQFILLSSEDEGVTSRSVAELEYHAEFAGWVGADVINIHGGGAYGDKISALKRVERRIRKLKKAIRSRLTLENDDRVYTPADLFPLCEATGVPLVYDVHHHRCLPDGHSVEEVTARALKTWNREPLFHISSPREGWTGKHTQYHHDYIHIKDFPACWSGCAVTVEVEAKAKELAVLKLMYDLGSD